MTMRGIGVVFQIKYKLCPCSKVACSPAGSIGHITGIEN